MEVIKRSFEEFCNRSGQNFEEVSTVWNQCHISGSWLGGGALRRTLIGQPLDSDFDFFFENPDRKSAFVEKLKSKGLSVTRETKHHTQLEGFLEGSKIPYTIQAIHFRYYKSAEEVLDSFDYTITQLVHDGKWLYTTPETLWDLGRKRLALHKVTYPVATMRRMLKYTKQGFTACGGCMADLYTKTLGNDEALGQLDIEYVD